MTKISARRVTLRYPAEFNDEFKAAIKERDDHRCGACKHKKEKLDIHHIDYTKRTVPENCIALCRTCHERVHRMNWQGRRDIMYYFYAVINVKFTLANQKEQQDGTQKTWLQKALSQYEKGA